jgi:hypothetical protein
VIVSPPPGPGDGGGGGVLPQPIVSSARTRSRW